MNYEKLTIFELHRLFEDKKVSPVEVTEYFLKKIDKEDKDIKAFLSVDKEESISQAKEAEKKFNQGKTENILMGIPGAIKDNILIRNKKTTAGSLILKDYLGSYDATVINKLRNYGPAVILGKTNLDEFAMGSSTEYSAFHPTRNPHDLNRVPGGSSGGSAAAVAAGECLFALGSETNGSVRLPAAFCGIVGLKPTYGSVSRSGLIAMTSSLDVIGPMTKTVKEASLVFEAISGRDSLDSTSFEDYDVISQEEIFKKNPKEITIGVASEYFSEGLDKEIKEMVQKTLDQLSDNGFSVKKVSLPNTGNALAAYYIIMPAEVSANMARYDGIRYGGSVRNKNNKDLLDVYLNTRKEMLGTEVKRRIMLGTYVLSAGYYDAYYSKAQAVKEVLKSEFLEVFKEVDVLVAPVSPTPAFKFGEKTKPVDMYLTDIFTSASSLAGLPAISLPRGKNKDGLPMAIQIIGKLFKEEDILLLADYIEREIKA